MDLINRLRADIFFGHVDRPRERLSLFLINPHTHTLSGYLFYSYLFLLLFIYLLFYIAVGEN